MADNPLSFGVRIFPGVEFLNVLDLDRDKNGAIDDQSSVELLRLYLETDFYLPGIPLSLSLRGGFYKAFFEFKKHNVTLWQQDSANIVGDLSVEGESEYTPFLGGGIKVHVTGDHSLIPSSTWHFDLSFNIEGSLGNGGIDLTNFDIDLNNGFTFPPGIDPGSIAQAIFGDMKANILLAEISANLRWFPTPYFQPFVGAGARYIRLNSSLDLDSAGIQGAIPEEFVSVLPESFVSGLQGAVTSIETEIRDEVNLDQWGPHVRLGFQTHIYGGFSFLASGGVLATFKNGDIRTLIWDVGGGFAYSLP
jgi:hypothetical protein